MDGGAPRVVRREGVVDVHLDVVAVQAQVGALGHPVDEPGGQQQPLQLAGVVVEVQRELGHPGLRVGARVLVHPGQDVPGGVGQERRVRSTGGHRGPVAVGAGGEGDRARQLGEGGQPGGGQRRRGAVQGPARSPRSRPGRGRGTCSRRPGARRRSTRRCPARSAARRRSPPGESAITTPLKLPVVPLDSAGRVTVSRTGRARGVDLGVGHPLAGQRRTPRPPSWDRPTRSPISRTFRSSVGAVAASRRGRRGRRPRTSSRHPGGRKHRGQAQTQPSHTTAPATRNGIPHQTRHPSQKTYAVQYHRK